MYLHQLMELKANNALKDIIVLKEQLLCYLAQVAHMNLEKVQVSASHVLLVSIALRDQFCRYRVLLAHIVLENHQSLNNVL